MLFPGIEAFLERLNSLHEKSVFERVHCSVDFEITNTQSQYCVAFNENTKE